MCISIDRSEQTCGILVLNEVGIFVYRCVNCESEFETGAYLEIHILSDHVDNKRDVFVDDGIFIGDSVFQDTVTNCEKLIEDDNNNSVKNLNSISTSSEDGGDKTDELLQPIKRRGRPRGSKNRKKSNSVIAQSKVTKRSVIRPRKCNCCNESSDNLRKTSSEIDDGLDTDVNSNHIPSEQPHVHLNDSASYKDDNCHVNGSEAENRPIINGTKESTLAKVFYCEMCPDESFTRKKRLIDHMKRHQVRQLCTICKSRPRNYKHHMNMYHCGLSMFECDYCGAKFKSRAGRVIHMRSHTGERPYLCVICGRTFSARATWRKHEIRVHTTIRQHQCKQCDRSFYSPYQLKDHVNAFHTHERPHVCCMCGKGYTSRSYLRIHLFTHGEKVLKCRFCERRFKLTDNRRLHEKTIHGAI